MRVQGLPAHDVLQCATQELLELKKKNEIEEWYKIRGQDQDSGA